MIFCLNFSSQNLQTLSLNLSGMPLHSFLSSSKSKLKIHVISSVYRLVVFLCSAFHQTHHWYLCVCDVHACVCVCVCDCVSVLVCLAAHEQQLVHSYYMI